MSHGQDYRDKMEKLVKECSHNGKLDLKELHHRTVNLASDLLGQSVTYQNDGSSQQKQNVRNEILKDLTVATHEILGLIPKDKWDHSKEGFFAKDPGRQNTLIPIKDGQIFNTEKHTADIGKPLHQQGFEFVTVDYLVKNQEKHHGHDDEHPSRHGLENQLKPKPKQGMARN